jgi:ABC-type transporter Mla subunit MlaD
MLKQVIDRLKQVIDRLKQVIDRLKQVIDRLKQVIDRLKQVIDVHSSSKLRVSKVDSSSNGLGDCARSRFRDDWY